ncbi:MAG: PQQ-binding-like beta-propeller repeat protein [Acidimicrobiales bacterium]
MKRAASIGLCLVASVGLACTSDDAAEDTTDRSQSSAPAPTDWPTAGFDLSNSRAIAGGDLTTATVGGLTEQWTADVESLGSLSTVPIVVDGVVYAQGGSGQVAALELATGDTMWLSEPNAFNIGPFGVAVDDTRVYALDGSVGVQALDRETGEQLWATDVTATDTTGIGIQPVVAGDLVIVSSVPVSISGIYTGGDRGVVTALDRETGVVRWEFDTVEGDDLWGNPEVNSGGGAWYPPAVDLERGLVYVGVANPAPFPGTPEHPNGTSRPGDNLYTDSVVALDLATGALEWFHQVIPHDIFDRDQVHAQLVALPDGTDVVVSSGKSGVVVGVDPDDGAPRWTTEVGVHENDDLTELDGPTTVAPGTYGGVLTPPAWADGVVYLAVVNSPVELVPDATAYFGADVSVGEGEVVAVDAATGEVQWATTVPGQPLGAATVVNDLVLTTLLDGTLLALDRESGEIVHSFELGGGTNGWMAVVDDTLVVPLGTSPPARIVALGL